MTTFQAGTLVTARGREWVVLPNPDGGDDMLVLRPLGGADDDIAAVFPAFEQVEHARFVAPSPDDVGNADMAGMLRSALRIGFRAGAGPFRSLAGIAVEPRAYQLVPLLMALRQQTVRMLISDDVGIGKTVEAGLIASELLAQGEARGLAVLCSPALAEQWQQELRTKFGIDAELVLASTVNRLNRSLDLGQSLFCKYPVVIVSTDFIKSTRNRDDFVRHCPDLVIVDEAHTCVAADDAASSQNQLRYELLKKIAADQERHLLLVTATPHSGKESAFRNLLGLVKPELASVDLDSDRGRRLLAQHFVQRKRADVRHFLGKDDGLADDRLAETTEFPGDRKFKEEPYKLSPKYRALLDDAIAYAGDRVAEAGTLGKREARIAWWSAIALLRSMVSSPRAAAQTLKTRSASVLAATAEEADRLGWPLNRDAADNDALEGIDVAPGAETEEQSDDPAAATPLGLLARRAEELEGPAEDLKLKLLVKQAKDLIKDGYHPIVFCRYIPTAEYVKAHLHTALGKKAKVEAVTGTLSPQQRVEKIESLAQEAAEAPGVSRVLVATDCLSEGVNLQHYFDAVIHYDLAWNPTRHDQREGRVDRFGQQRAEVRVITLFGEDNGIDGKVLEVLIKKHRQIRKDLGISVSVPDEMSAGVTDAIVEWLLMRGQEARVQGTQESLFEGDGLAVVDAKAAEVEKQWNSAIERESQSRSRFAQRSIHPEEVAREVAAVRAALGGAGEVASFVRTSLQSLGGVLRESGAGSGSGAAGDFTADLSGTPAGLQDTLALALPEGVLVSRKPVTFRTTPAVARGEAALVRTDPVVGSLAAFVLNAALDGEFDGPRPARRCGVMRTRAVTSMTTLLLVRYRFHLTLPSRHGDRQLVAEDARLLAFEGVPGKARWLADEDALRLIDAEPAGNTDRTFAANTMRRFLDQVGDVVGHIEDYGDTLATELDESHRRVRSASGEIVRGLRVRAQKPADILGAYVYLPIPGAVASSSTASVGGNA